MEKLTYSVDEMAATMEFPARKPTNWQIRMAFRLSRLVAVFAFLSPLFSGGLMNRPVSGHSLP